jgi:sterol desaturase/sphingolipid hydroxylase (fatty acid hydroxylase superfamily)
MLWGMLVKKLIAILILSVLFAVLERLRPAILDFKKTWSETRTDLLYLFLAPPINQLVVKAALFCVAVFIVVILGHAGLKETVKNGHGFIATLPQGLQIPLILIVGDFTGYWMHRLFHSKHLWKFHAIHHGSESLNWISSARVHPFNIMVNRTMQAIVIVSLGFPAGLLAAYVPLLTLYGILLHANVSWDFGPLRKVLASPVFHRWHHTSQQEGLDKNFAGFFPFLDILFGTFHMPTNAQPMKFGISGEPVPQGFFRQLLYPFKS